MKKRKKKVKEKIEKKEKKPKKENPKQKRQRRPWNIKDHVSLWLCLVSVWYMFLRVPITPIRFVRSVKDLVLSLVYYVLSLFGIPDPIHASVKELPKINVQEYLSFDLEDIARRLRELIPAALTGDAFRAYLIYLSKILNRFSLFLNLALCIYLLVYLIYSGYAERHKGGKKKREKKEKTNFRRLRCFLKKIGELRRAAFRRVAIWIGIAFRWCRELWEYIRKKSSAYGFLLWIWLINTNLLTIVSGAIAYYLYFIASFDLLSFFVQLVKLIFDLIIAAWSLPGVVWCVILWLVFDYARKQHGLKSLRHLERKNRGFLNSTSAVVMLTGSMGTGKTRMAVDLALSCEQEFRFKALELMNKNILRFPRFDFVRFQKELTQAMEAGTVKNWDSCRRWVRKKRIAYVTNPCPEKMFGYDAERYPTTYNDDLKTYGIWEMMENYAQEYFLYVAVSSLIISNLSIRSDVEQKCTDYFPRWEGDFFTRDPAKVGEYSKFAHIIDFDLFRLGRQLNEWNRIAGSFEFGVIVCTEIGKERGNNLENQEKKKKEDKANQKNDMFNEWMKLLRHAGTVEGVCFVKLICDEQRATSWGADARDTATVINIKEVSERGTTLPYCILPWIYMYMFIPAYSKYYNKVMNYGNTGLKGIRYVHTPISWCYARSDRVLNRYSAMVANVTIQEGNLESEPKPHEYYIMPKKIYSQRYSTDCYKDYFSERAKYSSWSLIGSRSYENVEATLEELEAQNSYLIERLSDMMRKNGSAA